MEIDLPRNACKLAINNLQREISGFHHGYEINLNLNISDHETQTGEKNVRLLIDFILKHENPFKILSHQSELYDIFTKEVISNKLVRKY